MGRTQQYADHILNRCEARRACGDEDGDAPGVICLENDSIVVKESAGYASLTLTREEGSHGVVSCTMNTKDGSAVAPADYAAIEDEEVVFAHGETRKAIKVHIVSDEHFEGDEDFSVVFSDATGGASFSEIVDGGPERAIANHEKGVAWTRDNRPMGSCVCWPRRGIHWGRIVRT